MQIADQALQEAWKIDPTISSIADEMITVCLGQGGGRGRMEIWFRRAVEANPDDYPVCSAQLYYLYPRWRGSHQEMIAFGRQCAAGENYLAGIPFILAQAHAQVAEESPDPQAYLQGDEVWADVSQVFDDALQLYPHDASAQRIRAVGGPVRPVGRRRQAISHPGGASRSRDIS